MNPAEAERFLEPTLSRAGFKLVEIHDNAIHQERAAWAVFYRGHDCKLQVCWSAREGGVDFMLAPLDAPNAYGLTNGSKKWRFMLALSDATDDLGAPPLGAAAGEVWAWRSALFDAHFEAARDALLGKTKK
jgi:hypothetical protein